MSGRIKVEDSVWWLNDWHGEEVHEYKGCVLYGEPQLASVPKNSTSSRSNARYGPTGGVLFGMRFNEAVYDSDDKFTGSWWERTVVLHMTKREGLYLARTVLNESMPERSGVLI